MDDQAIMQCIIDLMENHQVPIQVHDEWIVPYGQLPAIRANWLFRETHGRLDIEVLLEDQRIIVESFAGVGAEQEVQRDALQNFCVNTFHVLLAAFW